MGLLCAFTTWKWRTAEEALRASQSQLSNLRSENEQLRDEITRLSADLASAQHWPYIMMGDFSTNKLKALGLADPIANLISSLEGQADLIPFQPIGGGRASPRRIAPFLINEGWIVAGVSDGHKGIVAILGYEVHDGQISWRLIAAEPDAPAPLP